tara:strand:+ start:1440 stop:2096 length:657 start_codon:yes stop_codon:yes gene_type:complete
MQNKIIVSGCSYSTYPKNDNFPNLLAEKYNCENIAISGHSNYSITKKIYDYIEKTKVKDSLFICQLTYTHRLGFHHNINNLWIDYLPEKYGYKMPNNLNIESDIRKKLETMYKTYLKYVYDEDVEFFNLMRNVDLLKSYVESSNNKILFINWPKVNQIQKQELKKRNFFNINEEYSMFNWSCDNKLTAPDTHLNSIGANQLKLELEKEYILKNYLKVV